MEIYNYMEDIVKNELEKLFSDIKDTCKCEKCKLDIIALALNRLPGRYVVSAKGRVYAKLSEVNAQFQVDVMASLTKAILQVSKNPQH